MFAVRTEGDPLWFVNAIRSQVLAIDRDQPITAVRTMDDVVEASEGQRRSIMILLGMFAGAALLLAVRGISWPRQFGEVGRKTGKIGEISQSRQARKDFRRRRSLRLCVLARAPPLSDPADKPVY